MFCLIFPGTVLLHLRIDPNPYSSCFAYVCTSSGLAHCCCWDPMQVGSQWPWILLVLVWPWVPSGLCPWPGNITCAITESPFVIPAHLSLQKSRGISIRGCSFVLQEYLVWEVHLCCLQPAAFFPLWEVCWWCAQRTRPCVEHGYPGDSCPLWHWSWGQLSLFCTWPC